MIIHTPAEIKCFAHQLLTINFEIWLQLFFLGQLTGLFETASRVF